MHRARYRPNESPDGSRGIPASGRAHVNNAVLKWSPGSTCVSRYIHRGRLRLVIEIVIPANDDVHGPAFAIRHSGRLNVRLVHSVTSTVNEYIHWQTA